MESRFVTLVDSDNDFIKVYGKDIVKTDIPILLEADTTISQLKNRAEYVHIDFDKVSLIGISIVKLHK
jgi:hypothetical protein